jgi:hypothetical protein
MANNESVHIRRILRKKLKLLVQYEKNCAYFLNTENGVIFPTDFFGANYSSSMENA